MRILMVVTNEVTYDPRVRAEAEALITAGHDVTVLGWDRRGTQPREETLGIVPVVRLQSNLAIRARGFDILRLRPWWRLAVRKALLLHAESPLDVVHCHDLDTLPVGVRLKARLGIRLVYDAHEIWPLMVRSELPWPIVTWLERLEKRMCRHVDHAFAAAGPYADHVQPLVPSPVTVLLNAKEVPYHSVQRPPAPFTACAIGSFSPQRMTAHLPRACATAGVDLLLAGWGKGRYTRQVLREAAKNHATYLGRIAPQDVLPRTRASHVVLCPFDPQDPFMRKGLPNKLFEAMSCARPIIATEGTYLGDLVVQEDVGLAVPFTAAGVAEGLRCLQDEKRWDKQASRALRLARRRYNWPAQAKLLIAAYETIKRESFSSMPSSTQKKGGPLRGQEDP